MPVSGWRAISRPRMAGPFAPTGMKKRSFHEMISWMSPIAREPLAHAGREAGELDPVIVHHPDAAQLQAVGKLQDALAVKEHLPRLLRGEVRRVVEAEIAAERAERGRRDQPPDDALALVGLEPVDAAVLVRQPPPDRQQQPRRDMEACSR